MSVRPTSRAASCMRFASAAASPDSNNCDKAWPPLPWQPPGPPEPVAVCMFWAGSGRSCAAMASEAGLALGSVSGLKEGLAGLPCAAMFSKELKRKKRSKASSYRARSGVVFASVVPSALFRRVRSLQPTSAMARAASTWAFRLISRSLPRSALKKSSSVACTGNLRILARLLQQGRQLLAGRGDVLLELEEDTERALHHVQAQVFGVQQQQRFGPVDGLADRGLLFQVHLPHRLNESDQFAVQCFRQAWHAALQNAPLQLRLGEWNVQVQAAALERVAHLARVVAGEKNDGLDLGLDGAEFGHRDLKVGQHFEQESLELGVGLVNLVHQQHAAALLVQGLIERARLKKVLGEEQIVVRMQPLDGGRESHRALHHLPQFVLEELRIEQLLAVFPLVQGLGFVQAFETLHADQGHVENLCHALGQFGLADAGRAFDKDRLFQIEAQIDRGGDFAAGNVVDRSQPLRQAIDGVKVGLV